MRTLRVLHINDLHSHFEAWPKLARFFEEKSLGIADCLRFDLGDHIDRSHPLSEATLGRANVDLMNAVGLTAATIGNNEGLGLPFDALDHLYDQANFPIVLSNLTDKMSGQLPQFAVDHLFYETHFGMRILIIGMTYPYYMGYGPQGWNVFEPLTVLEQVLNRYSADFVILLSHLGVNYDEAIAAKFDIDLIVGSHTHHVFPEGKEVNGTLLAAAGRYGEFVGEINLSFDSDNRLISHQIQAHELVTLPAKADDQLFAEQLVAEGRQQLQTQIIGHLPQALSNLAPAYEATHYIAQCFADYANVELAIINSGLVVGDQLDAEVTLDTLHQLLPHSMRLVRVTVTGRELLDLLTFMVEEAHRLQTTPIFGNGFRGKVFGDLVFHGLTQLDEQWYTQDRPIKLEQHYQLVVPDQYLFAPYFPMFKTFKTEILFPENLREVVKRCLETYQTS